MPTVFSPSSVAARITRMAISERFATLNFLMWRIVDGVVGFLGMVGVGKCGRIVSRNRGVARYESRFSMPKSKIGRELAS
jgi:hypothetical protein